MMLWNFVVLKGLTSCYGLHNWGFKVQFLAGCTPSVCCHIIDAGAYFHKISGQSGKYTSVKLDPQNQCHESGVALGTFHN